MKPYQIFADLDPETTQHLFSGLAEDAPMMYTQLLHAAAAAMKSRPTYLKKLTAEKRAAAIRRALARVNADSLAEETLAVYFLECRKPLLIAWLDRVGVAHEDGSLKDDTPPQPDEDTLKAAIDEFRAGDDAMDRVLLLRAFASQSAIEWPVLDAKLAPAT
jgi:hypothetical protein